MKNLVESITGVARPARGSGTMIHENDGREQTGPPPGWQNGWQHPFRLKSGEEPFQINGKWFLYVDMVQDHRRKLVVYDFGTDKAIPYEEFQAMLPKGKSPEEHARDRFLELERRRTEGAQRRRSTARASRMESRPAAVVARLLGGS